MVFHEKGNALCQGHGHQLGIAKEGLPPSAPPTHLLYLLQITAQAWHIPGHLNRVADLLSHAGSIVNTEWTLSSSVTTQLWALSAWGCPHVDFTCTNLRQPVPTRESICSKRNCLKLAQNGSVSVSTVVNDPTSSPHVLKSATQHTVSSRLAAGHQRDTMLNLQALPESLGNRHTLVQVTEYQSRLWGLSHCE